MNKKLNTWVYSVLSILIVYLAIDFIGKESKNFSSLNYDWSKETEIIKHDTISIDSISDDYLRINTTKKLVLQPQNTFKIENKTNSYYFRYTYTLVSDHSVVFKGLIWLNKQPENSKESYALLEIDLPLKMTKGIAILTIGDEQIFQNEAKYLRKELKRRTDVNFMGSKKDIYGFNYHGHKEMTFNDLMIVHSTYSKCSTIIIFLKPKKDVKSELASLEKFVTKIEQKKDNTNIIILTLPIYRNSSISLNDFNERILICSKTYSNVTAIDLNKIFQSEIKFYRNGINEISKAGYEKIAQEISRILQ